MRIRFSDDYDHPWPSGAETAYKAGMELTVPRTAGEAAIAAGKGKEVRATRAAATRAAATPAPAKRRPGRPPRKPKPATSESASPPADPPASPPADPPATD